jgi:hypothetical protein
MSKKTSDWHIPSDWAALLSLPTTAILAACLLAALNFLKTEDTVVLFYTALGTGSLGSLLLFFARLPLYQQRRFWTFGPRELPVFNRKLYWLAYVFVAASVLLLLIILCGTE